MAALFATRPRTGPGQPREAAEGVVGGRFPPRETKARTLAQQTCRTFPAAPESRPCRVGVAKGSCRGPRGSGSFAVALSLFSRPKFL